MADRAKLYIERAHLGRGLHVEAQATGAARRALGALAAFLQTLPLWAGGTGALIMSIADTTIIGAIRGTISLLNRRQRVGIAGQ